MGVEVLGSGHKRDAGSFEVVDDVQQPANGAGEPVQPVDQQHVVAACLGVAERLLQAVAVQGGAAGAIGVLAGQGPAVLAGDIGADSQAANAETDRAASSERGVGIRPRNG